MQLLKGLQTKGGMLPCLQILYLRKCTFVIRLTVEVQYYTQELGTEQSNKHQS